MDNSKSAPTGCFKCGRPGHWSRDCPSSATDPSSINNNNNYTDKATVTGVPNSATEKPKKVPRTRPKLTPELLLSEDGLGYVLRHFPRGFRYRGRGHEAKDLGNLIRLYREWHSHLLPYYSFDQFVHKAEQVSATKLVKNVIKDLRERVARGGDPTKLHEPPREDDAPNDEQAAGPVNFDELSHQVGNSSKDIDACDLQEAMLNEIYENATEDSSRVLHGEVARANESSKGMCGKELPNPGQNNRASSSSAIQITDEQRARMEANRLKALEKAVASSSNIIQITDEQKARMEANRLKALERAAARASSQQAT